MRLLLCALTAACVVLLFAPMLAAQPQQALVARGAELVQRYECARCHEGIRGVAPVVQERSCVRCHQAIHADRFEADPKVIAEWKRSIVHLRYVPSLTQAQARLRPDWLATFLMGPWDLRPRLDASMPRFAMPVDDARAIAAFLTEGGPPQVSLAALGDASRGRALMGKLGCMTCHTFTGAPTIPASPIPVAVPAERLADAINSAPDLRFTRDRFRVDQLPSWLIKPAALKPDTLMPAIPMSEAQALDITAAIVQTPLTPAPARSAPRRLPPLTRRVGWDEVEGRVFKKICWHCHADPDLAEGDGGPGNTGGFGFRGRGVSFASYEAALSGRLDDKGERRSLFVAQPDGTPFLVAVLMARHEEVAGQPVPGLRGMPLGLPPLPLEDIQLVESWIKQGKPR